MVGIFKIPHRLIRTQCFTVIDRLNSNIGKHTRNIVYRAFLQFFRPGLEATPSIGRSQRGLDRWDLKRAPSVFSRRSPLDKFGQFSDNRRQFDGAAPRCTEKRFEFLGFFGATRRIRTDDLLITNQLLYRLS